MNGNKATWRLAAAAGVVALVLIGFRLFPGGENTVLAPQILAGQQSQEVETMVKLLARDPRVRRSQTQRQVERVARFALTGASVGRASFYAQGLLRYYGERDLGEAEKAFRNAIGQDPNWSWAHNGLAIVLFDAGREEEANSAWVEAMRLDPKWSRPYSDRAILYRRAGRMEEAVAEIQKALVLDPDGAITHYNFGVLLDVQSQHHEARERYLRVLELDPELPAPYYNLACGYGREGNLDRALFYLEKAIALNEAFRNEAKTDLDFDRIRTQDAFAGLLEWAPQ